STAAIDTSLPFQPRDDRAFDLRRQYCRAHAPHDRHAAEVDVDRVAHHRRGGHSLIGNDLSSCVGDKHLWPSLSHDIRDAAKHVTAVLSAPRAAPAAPTASVDVGLVDRLLVCDDPNLDFEI